MIAERRKTDFTSGKVFWKIVYFVLPIMATNLLQTLYNAADMMVVSLSSEANAVGAIGTTGSFINLIVNVFIGFSVGANVVVAREIGAQDKKRAQEAVHTALLMAVSFGVMGMALGLYVTRPVLRLMGNSGNLLDLAVTYTRIYFLGVPFLATTNYLIAIFRAKGDAKTPLIVLMSTGILNVVMNLFFVLVCKFSVEGVALATSLSNIVSTVILLWKLSRDKDYTTFSFKKLKWNARAFKQIVFVGFPAGVQGALFSLSNMIIQSSVVSVNNAISPNTEYQPIVNGSAATGNLEGFVYMATNSVYQAAITFTSQNIGAEKPQRVKPIMYSCFLVTTLIGVMMTSIIFAFSNPLLSLYGIRGGAEGSLEALALSAAKTRLKCVCTAYFLCGLMEVCTGVLRGIGRSLTSTAISLIGVCLLRVVWMLTLFPAFPTLTTIFLSYPVTWFVTTIAAYTIINILLRGILKKHASINPQTEKESRE